MTYSETRADYLRQKYGPHDDESDGRYLKKRSKSRPKRVDHRHAYRNCVLRKEAEVYDAASPSGKSRRVIYCLGSVCSICGRVGTFDLKKDEYPQWREECPCSRYWHPLGGAYDAMIDKYRSVLETYDVLDGFGTKYVGCK